MLSFNEEYFIGIHSVQYFLFASWWFLLHVVVLHSLLWVFDSFSVWLIYPTYHTLFASSQCVSVYMCLCHLNNRPKKICLPKLLQFTFYFVTKVVVSFSLISHRGYICIKVIFNSNPFVSSRCWWSLGLIKLLWRTLRWKFCCFLEGNFRNCHVNELRNEISPLQSADIRFECSKCVECVCVSRLYPR